MSGFPTLKTGAVLQYPAQKQITFCTSTVRYIDGTEQRFPAYNAPIHRWLIRLDQLDETELHQLREFFIKQGGAAQNFVFTDPWDGSQYDNCNIEESELIDSVLGEGKAAIMFTIRENRA